MHKIKKVFKDYPFAHRQPTHDGHCKLVHGHNWDFEIVLECDELDGNGFVYDFGKFKWLRSWFEKMFDHTCLINEDDPELSLFKVLESQGLLDLRVVKSCSSEGLAELVYEELRMRLSGDPDCKQRGVKVSYVMVHEDVHNSAIYSG